MTAAEYLVEAEKHATTAMSGDVAERPVAAQLATAYATMALAAATIEQTAAFTEAQAQ
jgi:hypothetical protein